MTHHIENSFEPAARSLDLGYDPCCLKTTYNANEAVMVFGFGY